METKPISDVIPQLGKYETQTISTYGRVGSVGARSQFYFVSLRSGSATSELKLIIPKDKIDVKPTLFSTLQVEGQVTKSPDGKKYELQVEKVLFYGPFSPDDVQVPHQSKVDDGVLRKLTSQRLLTKRYQAISLAWNQVEYWLHQVSADHGLMKVRAPFITFSDCEGGGETFELTCQIPDFFKQKAYMTVSGQVDEETITSRFLCPTYIFGPSFRADPSKTRWHACEFYHYEPEIPFIDLDGLMDLEESILKGLLKSIRSDEKLISCMEILGSDQSVFDVIDAPFARVSYTEAIKILIKVTDRFEVIPKWGIDLGKEHERYLCEEHFKVPTFVYGYPSEFKSFYMLQCEPFVDSEISDQPLQTCEGVDLLVPGIGELCGASTREYRYDVLLDSIKKKGLKESDYQEYLDLRKQGTFPHGGFGMGFDRFMMWVFQIEHIRDLSPFPRYFHS